jgi:ribosome modulation factor
MNTAAQTKQDDRGYEDAIEGCAERECGHWYLRGYRAGITIRAEEFDSLHRELLAHRE